MVGPIPWGGSLRRTDGNHLADTIECSGIVTLCERTGKTHLSIRVDLPIVGPVEITRDLEEKSQFSA